MRIPLPANPDLLIKLAKQVLDEHTTLGAASPLNGIEGIASFGNQVVAADTNNQLAKSLYQQAEAATQARDLAIGPNVSSPGGVRFFLAAARDVLAGQNRGSKHKLGEWGYQVIASPVRTPEAKAAFNAARAATRAANKKAQNS